MSLTENDNEDIIGPVPQSQNNQNKSLDKDVDVEDEVVGPIPQSIMPNIDNNGVKSSSEEIIGPIPNNNDNNVDVISKNSNENSARPTKTSQNDDEIESRIPEEKIIPLRLQNKRRNNSQVDSNSGSANTLKVQHLDHSHLRKKSKVDTSRQEEESFELNFLPKSEYYELSYMHRSTITHVKFTKSGFLVTASDDGHFKFWKKSANQDLEFVKHYRAHMAEIVDLAVSWDGENCATVGLDKNIKVFDVANFDMINMVQLKFVPHRAAWIYSKGDSVLSIAVTEKDSEKIYIFDSRHRNNILHTITNLHYDPVLCILFNPVYNVVVSSDSGGMIEYWTGATHNYAFPSNIKWQCKTDTDLYEFLRAKSHATSLAISPNGLLLGALSSCGAVRIFNFVSARLLCIIDESLDSAAASAAASSVEDISVMELARRQAQENQLFKSPAKYLANIAFDENSGIVLYSTLLGIKMVQLVRPRSDSPLLTAKLVRLLGAQENLRFLQLAVKPMSSLEDDQALSGAVVSNSLESMLVASGQLSASAAAATGGGGSSMQQCCQPLLVATAFSKNRFYLFTNRTPSSHSMSNASANAISAASKRKAAAAGKNASSSMAAAAAAAASEESALAAASGADRDVINELPTKAEIAQAASRITGGKQKHGGGSGGSHAAATATSFSSSAGVATATPTSNEYHIVTLHTTMGDVQIRLYHKECPRTCENFLGHVRSGFYNGLIFHRVIKGFMVQTGCPLGTGCGGESIWGGTFADEFHETLRHNKPYMVSMANSGPNTNASQFFITVAPCPWLDNKHTVFGRVINGMDIVHEISNVRTDSKHNKPFEDVTIHSSETRIVTIDGSK